MIEKNPRDYQQSEMSFYGEGIMPVKRVKIRLTALPERIFSCVILRVDHGPINATVEIGKH